MAVKKKGLGRGLDALFPEKSVKPAEKKPEQKPVATNESLHQQEEGSLNASAVKSAAETKDTAQAAVVEEPKKSEMLVKISKVEPNRTQPRKQFDEDALLELSESIKQFGILQPLLVSDKGDYYEIIAGERRWRAAKLAGLKEVPVIIKEFNDQQVVEISLIENIQRESLNPIEEAHAYKRLMEEFHLRQDEIAERVSKSRTAVTNSMRLLKLDDRVQQMVVDEMLTTGHVRTLLALENKELQYNTAMKIFDEKLSVRETERLVKEILNPKVKKEKKVNLEEEAIYESLEEKIKSIIGTKVSIQRGAKHKGKIEIEYYSQEELERIMDLFESIQ